MTLIINDYKDVYKQERLTIYNMDCMELLKQVPDKYFDLAIVDPPYGNLDGKIKRTGGPWAKKYQRDNNIKKWDFVPNYEYFKELFRISKDQIIWGGNYFDLPPTRHFLIWEKLTISESFSMAMCEFAWSSLNENAKLFKYQPQDSNRIHPTQKPIALYTWILEKYAKPNFKILDTHFGSGSHGIANHYYGSELTACELDEHYFKSSVERIKKETKQLSFLIGGD